MAAGMSFVRNDSVLVAVVCLFLLLLLLSLTVVVCVLRRSAAEADGRSTDFDRHIEFEIDNNHVVTCNVVTGFSDIRRLDVIHNVNIPVCHCNDPITHLRRL